MINQILKAGLFLKVAFWIRPRLKALLISVGVIVLTWVAHGEYLSYVDRSENKEFLEVSYFIKWIITIFTCLGYGFLTRESDKANGQVKPNSTKTTNHIKQAPTEGDDGFDFLRGKAKLDSKADKILKKE